MATHWTARALFPGRTFVDRELCRETWEGLRKLVANTPGASLMPTHLHLLDLENADLSTRLKRQLGRLVPGVSWEIIATDIPNSSHLARRVRYVHLNPCRDQLCRDPLEWEWSTHRDYLGATADPWPDVPAMLQRFGVHDFHGYVSGDPSVHPLGTPAPRPLEKPALVDLDAFLRAAVLATRLSGDAFQRKGRERARLGAILHGALGVPAPRVAELLGMRPSSVRARPGKPDPWLEPILLTLNDARLMSGKR